MKHHDQHQHSERADATGTPGDTRQPAITPARGSAAHNPWRHTPAPISQADGSA